MAFAKTSKAANLFTHSPLLCRMRDHFTFQHFGRTRNKRGQMLLDPVRNHPVGCNGCRFALEETDGSHNIVPGIQDVIRHESRRLTDNRTKTCLHFLRRLVNLLMPRLDGVLPYRCVHSLPLSEVSIAPTWRTRSQEEGGHRHNASLADMHDKRHIARCVSIFCCCPCSAGRRASYTSI